MHVEVPGLVVDRIDNAEPEMLGQKFQQRAKMGENLVPWLGQDVRSVCKERLLRVSPRVTARLSPCRPSVSRLANSIR